MRIRSDIIEFASLSQSVMQLTKIVSDGVIQVAKVPDAPGIASRSHPMFPMLPQWFQNSKAKPPWSRPPAELTVCLISIPREAC